MENDPRAAALNERVSQLDNAVKELLIALITKSRGGHWDADKLSAILADLGVQIEDIEGFDIAKETDYRAAIGKKADLHIATRDRSE